MDETRALLDALMGPNRNQEKTKAGPKGEPDWVDRSVCKNFLVGFCPHDWFGSMAKRQLKPCTKIHSDFMKSQFEEHPDSAKYRVEYEEEFLAYLERIASECDQYIKRERPKCRPRGGKTVPLPASVQAKVEELEKRYADLIKSAEKSADEDSSLALSQAQMKQALAVKEELESKKQGYTSEFPGEDVCDICGVRYPCGAGWEGHDFSSHMRGKTHDGYAKIRQKIAELRGKKKEWEKTREEERDWFKARKRAQEKEADKERSKEKERERERQREREREKDKERAEKERLEREREKERRHREERERTKAREKERDRDRPRHKDKDRTRDRDKDRDADRDRSSKAKEKSRDKDNASERSRSPRKQQAADQEEDEVVLEVAEEDLPQFWATLGNMPADERADAMRALSAASSERLERWLEARIAARKGSD
mmetsp:Transcript_35953/g.84209  ORF Transcript_35953/g.84209 Transcript_35953/m.84209 type:complete len:428 (-) Transcript_35953:48-1331(-)